MQVPLQVAYFDLIGLVLLLAESKNIICLDASTFDVVYFISSDVFSLTPRRIWVDKFGISFAILCANDDYSNEQLEYWMPPQDYASAHVGAFDRVIVPRSGRLVNVTIETVNSQGNNCMLVTGTEDSMIHLWSVQSDRRVKFENSIELNLPSAARLSLSAKDEVFTNLSAFNSTLHLVPNDKGVHGAMEFLYSFGVISTTLSVLQPSEVDTAVYRRMLSFMQTDKKTTKRVLVNTDTEFPEEKSKTLVYDDSFLYEPTSIKEANSSPHVKFGTEDSPLRPMTPQERLNTPRLANEHSIVDVIPPQPLFSVEDSDAPVVLQDAWTHSNQAVRFTPSAALTSSRLIRPATSKDIVTVPEVLGVQFFLPGALAKLSTAASTPERNWPLRVLPTWNLVWKPEGDFALLAHKKLQLIQADDLRMMDMPDMVITHYALAVLSSRLVVVSSMRECLVFDIDGANCGAYYLPLCVSHNVNINSLVAADIVVHSPSSSGKPQSKSAAKVDANLALMFKKFLLVLVGDSEGYVHFFIVNTGGLVVHSDCFKAHNDPVHHLMVTGDASIAKWKVATELDCASKVAQVAAVATAGSAIVSISALDEVKVWLPCMFKKCVASHPERLFDSCHLKWRFTGIFSVGLHCAELGVDRKVHTIALAAGCSELIVGMTTGSIEVWLLPGLIETNENSVASAEKPLKSFQVHSSLVTSLRTYVHGPLAEAREVLFTNSADRDMVLAKLASFVRVPARTSRTLGYTFQDLNAMKTSSTLVSCSLDCSLILWTFEPTFCNYCSWLVPVAQRRFFFSVTPYQGIAFTNNPYRNYANNMQAIWTVSVLLNGLHFNILEEAWTPLFQNCSAQGGVDVLTDRRDVKKANDHNKSHILRFEDDVIFDVTKPFTPAEPHGLISARNMVLPQELLPPNPVVVGIDRPAQLVSCNKLLEEMSILFLAEQDACVKKPYFSLERLSLWSKVIENPPAHVVQLEGNIINNARVNSDHVRLDMPDQLKPLLAPVLKEVVRNTVEDLGKTQFQVKQSSPTKTTLEFQRENNAVDTDKYAHADESVKFTTRGYFLETDLSHLPKTKAMVEQPNGVRYVLIKDRPLSSPIRPTSRQSGDNASQPEPEHGVNTFNSQALKSTEYSFNLSPDHDAFMERDVGTPNERRYSPQLEDYLSRPASRESDMESALSSSNRTQISVEQVQFSKDDKVIRTIPVKESVHKSAKAPTKYRVDKKAEAKPTHAHMHPVAIFNGDALPNELPTVDAIANSQSLLAQGKY
ncbi:hypothetical protein EON64_00555 [archaeon]|nr:MAG: hypothetical protein EON64_00555 [archaeon]